MGRTRVVGTSLAVLAGLLCFASNTRAQQTLSGIGGAVKDSSGTPVAGVTVEATSPALIERVRNVTTDAQGQYKIVDLQPGSYSVTFKAPGFTTVKHDDIELPAGFTGTVNGDLKAGNPNETVTVTATVSLVDTRSATQQSVVSSETQNRLATGTQDATSVAKLTPGVPTSIDVGGSGGAYTAQQFGTVRGKSGVKKLFDGLNVLNMSNSSSYLVNSAIVAQSVVETGGGNAESLAAGGTINSVPKSGSNTVKWGLSGLYTREAWQGDNIDQSLRDRGLTVVNKIGSIWDSSATIGGPIKKDKLWYIISLRRWGNRNYSAGVYWNDTQGTPFYTPANGSGKDLFGVQRAVSGLPVRQGDQFEEYRSQPLRLTWQASTKNKLNFLIDYPDSGCTCRNLPTTTSPEAGSYWWFGHYPDFWGIDLPNHNYGYGLLQTTWDSARSSKLLLSGGWSYMLGSWPQPFQPTVTANDISINDSALGFRWNSPPSSSGSRDHPNHQNDRMAERFSVSYITGSHALKFGIQDEQGWFGAYTFTNKDVNYTFNNGVPTSVIEYATPYNQFARIGHDLGIYGQDQWTIKRLTLNYGLRFSYFNGFVPAQSTAPTQFVPVARNYDRVECVPCWKDLDPRFGAAYDLFGNGRTALRVTAGRFVSGQVVTIATANNPFTTSVNSVSRNWNDSKFGPGDPHTGNYVPDCDLTNPAANGECLAISDNNFGLNNPKATRYAADVINGSGIRSYVWDFSAEVTHQITRGIAVTGGYYRNWAGNFTVTDNTLQTPADFSPYCVTAPIDSRLPNGGGYPLCGLYNISVAKFSASQNLVTQASHFGTQTTVNDYLGGQFSGRFARDIRAGLSVDVGRTVKDRCFVVTSLQDTIYDFSAASTPTYCHDVTPWSANLQVKANGSMPVGYGFSVSPTLQNLPGTAITAVWAAPNSAVASSLGRNLSVCGAATACNATTSIPLIRPGTLYEPRRTQVDLRLSKSLALSRKLRSQWNVDVYNITNSNAVTSLQTAYGPQWLRPTKTLDARVVEVGGRIDF